MKTHLEISNILINFGPITEYRVDEFEDLVTEASEDFHQSMLFPLLCSLDDNCEFKEVMFGVIHALEKFPWDAYFKTLAMNVSFIHKKSPQWCEILHTRIINSPAAYTDFLDSFSNAPNHAKLVEIEILTTISKKEKFRESCIAGINILKNALQ